MSAWLWLAVAEGGYRWWGALPAGQGPAQELAALLARDAAAQRARRVLLLPGPAVSLHEVAFDAAERRVLAQSLPFALEERLAAPLEQLHIALGPVRVDGSSGSKGSGGGEASVAVIAGEALDAWLQPLQAAGCAPHCALPDTLALAWRPGQWTLYRGPAYSLLRTGPCSGLALEPDALHWVLQQGWLGEAPETLLCLGDAPPLPAHYERCRRTVPDAEPWAAEALPPLNLLQGRFAPALPWRRWGRQWRWLAAALAAVLCLQFGVALAEQQWLHRQQAQLQHATEQLFREVVPHGVMVDPEVQLRRLLSAAPAASGPVLLPLLAEVAQALAEVPGSHVRQLEFQGGRQGEQGALQLSVQTQQRADVEALGQHLRARGLAVTVSGVARDGAHSRAQLSLAREAR